MSTVSGISGSASVCRGVTTPIEFAPEFRIWAAVPPKVTLADATLVGKPPPAIVTVVPPSGGPVFGEIDEMKMLGSVPQVPAPPLPR